MTICIIKGIQDKLWVSYSNYGGDLEIDSIYIDSDVNKIDLYDYLSSSVKEKAYESMREDWAELKAVESHERYKCARYYDDQGGWLQVGIG